jgi:hypothetical protein
MSGMADEDNLKAGRVVTLGLDVHFRNKRAGCIKRKQSPVACMRRDRLRDAMGREDNGRTLRDRIQFFHKDGAFLLKPLNHIAIVNDLVPHIDRRAIFFERPLDDLDGPVNAGAEATRCSEQDGQGALGHWVHDAVRVSRVAGQGDAQT